MLKAIHECSEGFGFAWARLPPTLERDSATEPSLLYLVALRALRVEGRVFLFHGTLSTGRPPPARFVLSIFSVFCFLLRFIALSIFFEKTFAFLFLLCLSLERSNHFPIPDYNFIFCLSGEAGINFKQREKLMHMRGHTPSSPAHLLLLTVCVCVYRTRWSS